MQKNSPIPVSHQMSPSVHILFWLLILWWLLFIHIRLFAPKGPQQQDSWEAAVMVVILTAPVAWYVYAFLFRRWVRIEDDALEIITRFSRRRYPLHEMKSVGTEGKYVFWGLVFRNEMYRERLYFYVKDAGRLRPLVLTVYHLSHGTQRLLGRFDVNFNVTKDQAPVFYELYKNIFDWLLVETDRRISAGETVCETDDSATSRWEVDAGQLRIRQSDGLFKEYPLDEIEPGNRADSCCKLFLRPDGNASNDYPQIYSGAWKRPRAAILLTWLAWRQAERKKPIESARHLGPHYQTLFPLPFITVTVFCVFSFFSMIMFLWDDGTSDFGMAAMILAVPAVTAALWFLCRSLTFYQICRDGLEIVTYFPKKKVRPLFYDEIESFEYLSQDFSLKHLIRTFMSVRFTVVPDREKTGDRFRGPFRIRYFGIRCYSNKFDVLVDRIEQIKSKEMHRSGD